MLTESQLGPSSNIYVHTHTHRILARPTHQHTRPHPCSHNPSKAHAHIIPSSNIYVHIHAHRTLARSRLQAAISGLPMYTCSAIVDYAKSPKIERKESVFVGALREGELGLVMM